MVESHQNLPGHEPEPAPAPAPKLSRAERRRRTYGVGHEGRRRQDPKPQERTLRRKRRQALAAEKRLKAAGVQFIDLGRVEATPATPAAAA